MTITGMGDEPRELGGKLRISPVNDVGPNDVDSMARQNYERYQAWQNANTTLSQENWEAQQRREGWIQRENAKGDEVQRQLYRNNPVRVTVEEIPTYQSLQQRLEASQLVDETFYQANTENARLTRYADTSSAMPPQAPSEAGLLTFTSNNPALTQPVTDPVNRLKEETLAFFVRRGAQAPEGSLAYRFYGTGYAVVGALAPESVPEFMAGAALGPVGSKVGGLGIKQLNRLPVLGADVGEGIAQGIQGSAKYLRDLGVPDWKITPRPYEYGTLNANPLPLSFGRVVGGTARATEFSPIPESYMKPGATIDMRKAPESSGTNAAGFPRNGPWFWRQMAETNPEYFDAANLAKIRAGRSPVVNDTWIENFPQHQGFSRDKLVHHHIDQGPIATPLPETIHQKWYKALHPNQ
ncbi:hypothetical protein [Parvibium lacunae]|uniref:Tox-HNH-HHH domain-containing protein n=1 Tax=Parvibium lacunae TaxID=1888893 RepID=A0A368L1I9_9BURK|nr:hypothetical protein [Parvibium lacunae]RCS56962.1 hypothetical protein DU000_09120 [Parvibium lacunae]